MRVGRGIGAGVSPEGVPSGAEVDWALETGVASGGDAGAAGEAGGGGRGVEVGVPGLGAVVLGVSCAGAEATGAGVGCSAESAEALTRSTPSDSKRATDVCAIVRDIRPSLRQVAASP